MTSSVDLKPSDFNGPAFVFSLNERCDKCGAEALARVIMPIPGKASYEDHTKSHSHTNSAAIDKGDYDLLFCGHHMNEKELAVVTQGGTITRKKVVVENKLKGAL